MASLNTPLISAQKPKLLDQLRSVIRLRHYSIRTEEAYTQWVKRFIFFHGKRRPDEMGRAEIETFLTHLAVEKKIAASTQNQALNAPSYLSPCLRHAPFRKWLRYKNRSGAIGT